MSVDFFTVTEKYLVCHNQIDIFLCVHVQSGSYTTTGQLYLEVFDSFEDAYAIFGDKIKDPVLILSQEDETEF